MRWRWLVAALSACLTGPALALELTAEERAWLAANGPVRVVVGPPTPYPWPYYTVQAAAGGPGAQPLVTGYAADLMALVAERTGMAMRFVSVPDVPTGLAMMRAGQVQMSPFLRMTPARRSVMSLPAPMLMSEMVWVVRRDAPAMDLLRQQPGLRAAVPSGTPVEDALRRAFPSAQIRHVNAEAGAIPPVADGSADIALVDIHAAIQTIERNRLPGLQIRRVPGVAPAELGPVVGIQFPLLHSIMAKALASISPAERALLSRRWLPQGVDTAFGTEVATLSAEEHAWVERQAPLRLGLDLNQPPLTQGAARGGAAGGFSGLAADVLRQAAQKTGLRIGVVQGARADEVAPLARAGQIDIAVGLAHSAANDAEFLLVGPYLRAPTVIVMPVSAPQRVTELRDLGAGEVAVLRGDPLLPELASRMPALRTLAFDTQDEALQAVAGGRAAAAIGNAFTVNHLIQQRYTGRLQVSGVVRDGDVDLHFGVPRSNPQLARVLALGFDALTPSDMAALRQRWLLARIDGGLRWAEVLRWALPIAAALLAVVAVLVLANRRLRAARQAAELARAEAEAATAARGRFLAYLAHEVRGLVDSIGWGARLMLARTPNAAPEQVAAWIGSAAERTGRLLENTLENERAIAHGVVLAPAPHELADWWRETLAPHELTAASKALALQVQAPQADAPLRFDGLRLGQVLNNLVGNAIKFTAQGEVAVKGEWDAAAARLRVEVLDSGPGLAADEKALLWRPYAQGSAGREAGAGAGLGLAITQQIVSAMRGTVQADARPQGGSRFWFEVPLEKAA